jgi:pilus assembly protein CpaF
MNGFELILPFLRPVEHLILDPDISEIMVNGPDRIFVEMAGYLQRVPEVKLTPESLIVAVKNIARRPGDDISDEKPILDSRLPDGSRVAALIPPCSIPGVTRTIRKFNAPKFRMNDLLRVGMLTPELAGQLAGFVTERKNILICGGTSCGKTTFLSALAEFIPDDQRIFLIEDTAEIQIEKENIVRFEARREQNGLPAVTFRHLLKATLRHRQDRIVSGGIRGGEAFDLLQLLNIGHSGTLSTVRANSAAQGISRVATVYCRAGSKCPMPPFRQTSRKASASNSGPAIRARRRTRGAVQLIWRRSISDFQPLKRICDRPATSEENHRVERENPLETRRPTD